MSDNSGMGILPAGRLNVTAHESHAPDANVLLGRPHIPLIAGALAKVEASVRGFVDSPLHPFAARDKLLAQWDRGIDVEIGGGARLRALDAVDGRFNIHLTPATLDDGYSLHVSLAPEGGEKDAVVQNNPHSPNAPVGFYNVGTSQAALTEVRRVLSAALANPDTADVDKLRAQSIVNRLDSTATYLGQIADAVKTRPLLARLPEAAALAHDLKKAGDDKDKALTALTTKIESYVAAGADGLAPELIGQVKEDLATIAKDRKKWIAWRASTGVFTYYVSM